MKPVCLKMSAFGAYAEEQELDFSELKGRSFFLIHGPTGAGKTTILDAMCFALYGDTSGGQRDGRAMRSDHAAPTTLTQVDFIFQVGQQPYQVCRTPEQLRPKKRGEGVTQVAAEAALWRLAADGERTLLAGRWNEVTQQVETLLGFKCSQFRQVVLLPQGDFRRLLTANSAERQEIMQTLFKTEQYRNLEELLKEKAQGYKKQFEELARERQWILQESGLTTAEELQERLQGHRLELQGQKEQLAQSQLQLKRLQQEMVIARTVEMKLAEQQSAQQALAELTEKLPKVETARLELAKGMQAAALVEGEKQLLQWTAEEERLTKAYEQLVSQEVQHKRSEGQAEERLQQEQAKEPERLQIAQERLLLEQVAVQAGALKEATLQAREKKAAVEKLSREKEQLESRQTEAKKRLELLQAEEGRLVLLAAGEQACQAEVSRCQGLLEKQQLKQAVSAEVTIAEAKAAKAKERLTEKESLCQNHRQQLQLLEERWRKGQAAVLAATLEEGESCPVCGSLHHPQPAVFQETVPTEEVLKQQQGEIEKLERQREELRQAYQVLEVEIGKVKGRLSALIQETAENSLQELQQAMAKSQRAYQEAVEAGRKMKALAVEKEQLTLQATQLAQKVEAIQETWQAADRSFRQAEAVVIEREAAVPLKYRSPGTVEAAQEQCRGREEQLKAALLKAQHQWETAREKRLQCQTEKETVQRHCLEQQQRRQQLATEFTNRLTEKGFESMEAFQQAKRSEAYLEKLQERMTIFSQQLAAAKERLARAEEQAKDLLAPEMTQMEEQAAQQQELCNQQVATLARLEEQTAREQTWQNQLAALSRQLGELEERYGVIGRLAEVANGGNEYKLTFQRFVLGALLDDVALAANQRLRMMSRGRYELQRTMDRARKNAAGGLDLEVFDHYTGIARGVSTLSGGETFLASLSLALGLADVVQAYAGGIHLETILVDEGFGTLDPEALDFAIRALVDLQKGGRLVGIISHVPELQERMDARLEVTRTDRGSRAAFRVG